MSSPSGDVPNLQAERDALISGRAKGDITGDKNPEGRQGREIYPIITRYGEKPVICTGLCYYSLLLFRVFSYYHKQIFSEALWEGQKYEGLGLASISLHPREKADHKSDSAPAPAVPRGIVGGRIYPIFTNWYGDKNPVICTGLLYGG